MNPEQTIQMALLTVLLLGLTIMFAPGVAGWIKLLSLIGEFWLGWWWMRRKT